MFQRLSSDITSHRYVSISSLTPKPAAAAIPKSVIATSIDSAIFLPRGTTLNRAYPPPCMNIVSITRRARSPPVPSARYQMLLGALIEAEREPPDEYLDVLGLRR